MEYIYISQYDEFQSHLISQVLSDEHIEFMLKDAYGQSLNAGWMDPGASHNSKELFVKKDDAIKAKKLIDNLNIKQ
tara:strand:- start:308 stop:535 length:228 start_codon:yes stop_codon:yes gene_type:complete